MVKVVGAASVFIDIYVYFADFAKPGETVIADGAFFGVGGKGNNQMTACRAAGAEVFPISKIGNDFLADIAVKHFEKTGMSLKRVEKIDGVSTGFADMEVSSTEKQNKLYIVKGASAFVKDTDVYAADEDFKDCSVVLTQFETDVSSVFACKALAEKYGKPFILNCAPAVPVSDELFCGLDFITPNETEAEFYTGIKITDTDTAREAAKAFIGKGVKNVIITLGKEGAYYTNGETELFVPGLKVEAVDPTGAGDTFNGYFACALAEGNSVLKSMRLANCAAALSVTKKGASASIPARGEAEAFYESNYGEKF